MVTLHRAFVFAHPVASDRMSEPRDYPRIDPWRLPTRPAEEDTAWRAEAACRDLPTAWWFPTRGEGAGRGKTICLECPVRSECLAAALAEEANWGVHASGVRGGLSPRQRARLRRDDRAGV